MRPEQVTKLASIEEELIDVFVGECEAKKWPGMEDVKDRGDRYWHKKNALATLNIVARIQTVLRETQAGDKGDHSQPAATDGAETREEEARRLTKAGIALLERHRAVRRR